MSMKLSLKARKQNLQAILERSRDVSAAGGIVMGDCRARYIFAATWFAVLIGLAASFAFSPLSRAQNVTDETPGMDSGNYKIQQSIEVGYRSTFLSGNIDTYD